LIFRKYTFLSHTAALSYFSKEGTAAGKISAAVPSLHPVERVSIFFKKSHSIFFKKLSYFYKEIYNFI